MTDTISQRELRNSSGAVLRRVEAGERLTITRRGVPVADLVPHADNQGADRPQFLPVAMVAQALGSMPNWAATAFETERAELDEALDDSDRDPWATR